ncbi:2OG-Fe(II) oxygenase, partial [bacterium]|nr:2OG-Fe(II) oxygenase [bacterium]
MIDFSNFEKINDEAYIWRNFLEDDVCDDAFNESLTLSQRPDKEVRYLDSVELLGGAMDVRIVRKVKDFFENTEFTTGNFLHWYTPDGVWFNIHRDDEAHDTTPLKKVWASVIYLADMNGGELLYPKTNTYVVPKKGDMVIHTSEVVHAATPVFGGNKRTITYVIYDTTQPIDPDTYPHGKVIHDQMLDEVFSSIEWLKSDFGKVWRKANNVLMIGDRVVRA